MKRILFTALISLGTGTLAFAQSEVDLAKLSRNDLTGTARSMSMGGAFGALGGDASGVAINPAGIGVYKSSEISATMNFRNNKIESNGNGGKIDNSKFQFAFDNLSIVGAFPIDNDVVPLINFGFSYNKLKNFDKKYNTRAVGQQNSLTDIMAYQAYGISESNLDIANTNPHPLDAQPWLPVFGYNTYLINPSGVVNGKQTYQRAFAGLANNNMFIKEKGSVDSYEFNAGTTFADIVSFGLTVAVTDLDYRMYSDYYEEFAAGDNYYLENFLRTEATGWQFKTGVIVKPINELRIGVAYHSPTWYEASDYYSARIDALGDYFIDTDGGYGADRTDYNFKTPDKWVFSLAGVIGQAAIISADYELTNYKNNMNFRSLDANTGANADFEAQNSFIKEDYRNASTLRLGAEVRFTPRFSGRVGYAWMQSPLQKDFKEGLTEVKTAGSVAHFVQEGDASYFTYGLGYKITSNFYADVAFVMKAQTDKFHAFTNVFNDDGSTFIKSDAVDLKNNLFSGLLTLGYRF